jgi:hypothetical protein
MKPNHVHKTLSMSWHQPWNRSTAFLSRAGAALEESITKTVSAANETDFAQRWSARIKGDSFSDGGCTRSQIATLMV